jgi:hypothetical protein
MEFEHTLSSVYLAMKESQILFILFTGYGYKCVMIHQAIYLIQWQGIPMTCLKS